MTPTLAFVGLGARGGRMARRRLAAGYPVVGYDRTAACAGWLVEAGLRPAPSPRAAAEVADVVFSMVTDPAALEAVTRGTDGILAGLRPGAVYVELSTVEPGGVGGRAAGYGARPRAPDRRPRAGPGRLRLRVVLEVVAALAGLPPGAKTAAAGRT